MASGLGVELSFAEPPQRLDRVLFGEGGARVIASVKLEQLEAWQGLIQRHPDVPVSSLGRVVDQPRLHLEIKGQTVLDCSVQDLKHAHEDALPRRLKRDAES